MNFCLTKSALLRNLPFSLDPIPEFVLLQIAAFENLGMRHNAGTTADIPQESHFSVNYLQGDKIVLQDIRT